MFLFTDVDRSGGLQSPLQSALPPLQSALQYASRSTGVDFDYLLTTAQRESNLDPSAKARTSSATGLFQFIESTWLSIVKETGSRHGYGDLARSIERTGDGGYRVADAAARAEILRLRNDPKAAALMAGELTRQNAEAMRTGLGRDASAAELYMAHFLGAQGATELVRLVETAPATPAAAHFPQAARANASIFFSGGAPRSAADVYAVLSASHGGSDTPPESPSSAFAFAPARSRIDNVFDGMFTSDTGAGALGPMGQAARSFWSGLFGAPASEPPPAASVAAAAYAPDAGLPDRARNISSSFQEDAERPIRVDRRNDPSLPVT